MGLQVDIPGVRWRGEVIHGARALGVAHVNREKNQLSPCNEILEGYKAHVPESAVFGILPVVSHHEKVPRRYDVSARIVGKGGARGALEGTVRHSVRKRLLPLRYSNGQAIGGAGRQGSRPTKSAIRWRSTGVPLMKMTPSTS